MKRTFLALAVMLAFSARPGGAAEERMLETFDKNPETRWRFIADTVMGGVSTGKVDFLTENGMAYARLTGSVSTENNGGFIQFRHLHPAALAILSGGLRGADGLDRGAATAHGF